ncbi:MAG: FAD-dependent oxidoreductase, partial [Deltaproteobacteria bacterium]|nr:FAD-dependent oxidoreductase [Deltaproteobacteria bacterium]
MVTEGTGSAAPAIEADVVVVGGGGAGLSAAVAAAEKGAKVVVLEKRNATGGNTAMAMGLFAAESPVQKRALVDASRDQLFAAMMDWTHWKVDPRIIRAYIDRSGDTIRWLEGQGCSFALMRFVPNQTPVVLHRPSRRAAVTDALRQSCEQLGVAVLVQTGADELLMGAGGQVAGVVASRRGRKVTLRAPAVVVATGGYGGNRDLIRKYASNYPDDMRCIGLPNMGDGLRMAIEAGAATEGLGMLQIEGPCAPRPLRLMIDVGESAQVPLMLSQVGVEPYAVWVNRKGERFIDETFGHSPFVVANGVVRQPGGACYALLDSDMVRAMSETGLLLARGAAGPVVGSSLPGLERELQRQAEKGVLYYGKVDPDLCNGCGVCVSACPLDLIRLDTVVADRGECTACRSACPAGVDMRRYLYLLRQGLLAEALEVLREENPFPALTGRVCPHPCEKECARGEVDEAVAIHSLERFLGDFGLREDVDVTARTHSERVAIVGSGPAGLSCAYFLARRGYPVTVFEALPVLGGMLRTGIPEYRLPKTVVQAQVEQLRDMGVAFVSGVAVGKDVTFEEVREDHQAVFLAAGNALSRRIPLEGSERDGVLWGLDFLRDVSLKTGVKIGERVVVIGGGNVAVDVALTALRSGARQVVMSCPETGEAIPAYREELD